MTFPNAALASLVLFACQPVAKDEGENPRKVYNQALSDLEAGTFDSAEKAFLDARDRAGSDGDLRHRAAYNLGVAQARHAEALSGEKPEEALELLRQAAGWFREGVRARPDDSDARVNLELVLLRARVLADSLNRGKNKLEARLDRVIDDTRGHRDRIRALMQRIDGADAGADPVAFQTEFDDVATESRVLRTEVETLAELGADEHAVLAAEKEEEMTSEKRARKIQLSNLGIHLESGTSALLDLERLLRRREVERGHRRSDAALASLVRAREQLVDPVAVLSSVAEDESLLAMHTDALARFAANARRVGGSNADAAKTPPWLTRDHLADRQGANIERVSEVLARFASGIEHGAGTATSADAKTLRAIQAARDAVPAVERAIVAMNDAMSTLAEEVFSKTVEHELESLGHLADAIERFSDVRQLIELAHRDQSLIVDTFAPRADPATKQGEPHPMPPAERARLAREATLRNVGRLARLEGMLESELADREAEARAKAAEAQGAAPDPQQMEAERARYAQAEVLRKRAHAAVGELFGILGAKRPTPGAEKLAGDALEAIEELRRLFFSIIEHLEELARAQAKTHDATASANALPEDRRAPAIGPAADFQARHAEVGDALAEAMEKQAEMTVEGEGANAQRAFAEAAPEVRSAASAMRDAERALGDAKDTATTSSIDLEPVLSQQTSAMEHLENALRILKPESPDGDQGEQQEKQQQQQQQQQQKKNEDDEQVSKREAQRRLQAIRERESERQRDRKHDDPMKPEPVEKDW